MSIQVICSFKSNPEQRIQAGEMCVLELDSLESIKMDGDNMTVTDEFGCTYAIYEYMVLERTFLESAYPDVLEDLEYYRKRCKCYYEHLYI